MASCNSGALSHSSFPEGTVVPSVPVNMPSAEQTLELLRERRSVRSFKEQGVEREKLDAIIRMTSYAPTAHNNRSVELIVVQDRNRIKNISKFTGESLERVAGYMDRAIPRYMMKRKFGVQYNWLLEMRPAFEMVAKASREGHDKVFHDAPVLIAFVSDPKEVNNVINSQLAIENALIATHAVGLGGYYCGFASSMAMQDERIRKELGLDGKVVDGIIAIGHPKIRLKRSIERGVKITWL